MEEIEISKSFNNKIDNINDSIDNIRNELHKIQIYSNLLSGVVSEHRHDIESSSEFKEIISKINNSIQKVNNESYILETNKLIKTKSEKINESITIISPIKNHKNKLFDESYDLSNCDDDLEPIPIPDSDSNPDNNEDEDEDENKDEDEDEELQNNSKEIELRKKNSSPQFDLNMCLSLIDKINFNVNFYISKKILAKIALGIFANMFNLTELKINYDSLKEFIYQVSLYYHNNPYHNFKHAISVLQFTYLMIIKTDAKKFMSNYELFGMMIASFVHDIDHPGHTNFFEVNIKSYLALKYNDSSVLENHHSSLAFFIIHSKNIQLLRNLEEIDFITVREMIIECVLSTDMKFHADLVKNLENKLIVGWNWESKIDKLLFAKIIIHTADISNQVRPFEVSIEGSLALRKEFAVQIEKEQQLNLPSLEYMKLSDDKIFYSSEHNFSVNTVKPIWNVLVKMFSNLNEYREHLDANIIRWGELLNGIGDEK